MAGTPVSDDPAPGDGPGARLRPYWEASAFAEALLAEFEAARDAGQPEVVRERFYVLASYFRRTLSITHAAFDERDQPLVMAALRNILVLQRVLGRMHGADPDAAPTTLALEPELHRRVNRDLVHRILRESAHSLDAAAIARRFNELDLIADARRPAIGFALRSLVATGHAVERDGRFAATGEPYVDANADRAGLAMLLGDALAARLAQAGFEGLAAALDRPVEFRVRLVEATGFDAEVDGLVVACAAALAAPIRGLTPTGRWQHANLVASDWPRPYQRLIQAIFRGHQYAGQVIEAPNGSGKTMIGMLCIEDWLGGLAPGQSILVLVPTVNYEQQWLGELCLKPIGLRLPPHLVHAGTPSSLDALRRSGGALPAVIVTTYPALARAASGTGKGGFDRDAIERFLQGNAIRHVILDEVHKVAADLESSTADCVRVMADWLRDGSLSSLIGFSGTLTELEPELASLGLRLAYVLPPAELIGQGWVAPFSELGIPFNYSEREQRIVALLATYRGLLAAYLRELRGGWLRASFAALPMADRVGVAMSLGMYGGRPEAEERIRERLAGWERDGELGLDELQVVVILQALRGWPDAALLAAGETTSAVLAAAERTSAVLAGAEPTPAEPGVIEPAAPEPAATDRLAGWTAGFDAIRVQLRPLLPPGRVRDRLDAPGFGTRFDAGPLLAADGPPAVRARRARTVLASTFVGLYLGLREWSRQAGEGRVEAVRSIITVERETRPVSGVIVFDNPAPLDWREGSPTPGYRGAGGLYLQLLADPLAVPIAALATELYLPDRPAEPPAQPLHDQIAAWILADVVRRDLGAALLALLAGGGRLNAEQSVRLRRTVEATFGAYAASLVALEQARMAAFNRDVVGPVRDLLRQERPGSALRQALAPLVAGRRHPHLRSIARSIFDYARLARSFREAVRVDALRPDGTLAPLRVVPMPGGDRRQRMYDLTARMVDAPGLPVDVVVVSSWARTGWNVTTPNVLVDATATRDVIAWQQLRGRAIRPWTSWSSDRQREVHHLLTSADGTPERREQAAAALMLEQSKVAHIYELVRGYGTGAQVQHDRADGSWERTDAIADKHRREWSVRASDGAYLAGPGHAPLMITADPRHDTPEMLRDRLRVELGPGDGPTILGWLRASGAARKKPGPAGRRGSAGRPGRKKAAEAGERSEPG